MSRRWLFLAAFLAIVIPSPAAADLAGCEKLLQHTGAPTRAGGAAGLTLCKTDYALAYNGTRKTAEWVLELLTRENIEREGCEREDAEKFAADPELPAAVRVGPRDYLGTKYQGKTIDRGHMAAAENHDESCAAMQRTFLMSNMAPQIGPRFNRGAWRVLETLTRDWAEDRGAIVVITGPLYDRNNLRIGTSEVEVPTAFYKIAYDPAKREAIAFLVPHQPLKSADLPKYLVTVRDVEQATGLRFLSKLSAADSRRIETQKARFENHDWLSPRRR